MSLSLKDHIENSGLQIDSNGKIILPSWVKHIKLDIGLAFDAPHSQNWLDQDESVLVFGFDPNTEWIKWITTPTEERDISFKDYNTYTKKIEYSYVGKRFFLIPIALSDVTSPTNMPLYVPHASGGCASLLQDRTLGGTMCTYDVQVFSLSDFLDFLPLDTHTVNYIDYIKIDVQGMDINVLKSAKNYLTDYVVYVTAEPENQQYYGSDNNTVNSMVEYMSNIGFIQINHPNTADPTFLNTKFQDKKDIYIWQRY
jgi:FkbM family methyltransferase